jgi:uncharacterized coiled-coil protein SlyX
MFDDIVRLLGAIVVKKLDYLSTMVADRTSRLERKMAELDDKIAALTADVAALTTVVESADAALNGIGDMIATAVAQALAAGATPAQLQALTDLESTLTATTASLAAAVAANTQPVTPPAA